MNAGTNHPEDKDPATDFKARQDSGAAAKTESVASKNSTTTKDSKPASSKLKKRERKKAFNWMKWLIIGAIALVVVAGLIAMMMPSSVVADVAMVDRGKLSVTVEQQGRTRALLRYTVSAPINGRLLRTRFIEGNHINAGDVLARIAPPPSDARIEATDRAVLAAAQARQREAVAARSEASGALTRAKQEAARREALFKTHVVSAESRDAYAQAAQAAAAKLKSAGATVAAAEAEVESARSRLLGANINPDSEGAIAIRAPVSGTVLRVREESERVVSAGTPLFDLSDGDAIELIIDVLTEEGVKVSAGDPIRVTGWGGDRELIGKVRYVEPGAFTKISALGVEEQRVNVIGDLTDPPQSLGAEFRIEAAIVTWSGEVLRIPTGAMFRRDNAWQVFEVKDGKAKLQKIEIGHRGKDFTEVTSGLVKGDRVIVFPSDQIEEGTRIEATHRG